jgi:hypothetical protein
MFAGQKWETATGNGVFCAVRAKMLQTEQLEMFHNLKSSVTKKFSGCESQGSWRQDELIGGKPPALKLL